MTPRNDDPAHRPPPTPGADADAAGAANATASTGPAHAHHEPDAPDASTRTPDSAGRHIGPANSSPYPVSRLAPAYDLVDAAREIQKADALLTAVAGSKLQLIAEQVRRLQDEAATILAAAERDAELHRAACNFQKRPGHTYHLYRDPRGRRYFSMLSPADWKGRPPDEFEGSYRLEVDLSFAPADPVAVRDSAERAARLRDRART